ncbi:MAG: SDR family NAD(P)-dependent oxidoreductase [Leptospirillia bacterium]
MPPSETILITGASGGIGAAVARAFAAPSRRLALAAHRSVAHATEVAQAVREAGAGVRVFEADLSTAAGCAALADAVTAWAGTPLTGIVHAAGGTRDRLAATLGEADWDQVMEVNLSAAWRLVRRIPLAKRGFIILIGSSAGVVGRVGQAPYAAAKAGIEALATTLAAELSDMEIRINSVLPGPVDTPMWRQLGAAAQARVLKDNGLSEVRRPEEVARFILALSGRHHGSGRTVPINGWVDGALSG